MTPQQADDDPRDAHLLAALRHAPDRDVVPPTQLTDAILGQARQAVRRPGARAWQERVHEFFERLWQPAPMAAFGTLALATLIGVMWRDREWPDATPSLRPERAVAAAEPGGASQALSRIVETPSPQQAKAARKAAPQAPLVVRAPAAEAPLSPPAARQDAPREPGNAGGAVVAAAAPAAVAAPAPAAAAADLALQREARANSQADAAPVPTRARSEVTRAAMGVAAPASSSPLTAANLEIEATLADDASRLRWRLVAQRLVAHGAAQRDWWQALAAATEGRWQAVSTGADSASVTLMIDGVPRGSLGFDAQAVIWRDPSGATWRAALAPDAVRALQESVARW